MVIAAGRVGVVDPLAANGVSFLEALDSEAFGEALFDRNQATDTCGDGEVGTGRPSSWGLGAGQDLPAPTTATLLTLDFMVVVSAQGDGYIIGI